MCRKKILQVWLHLTWKGKIANLENIVKVVFMGRHCYCTRPFHQYAQGKTKQNKTTCLESGIENVVPGGKLLSTRSCIRAS